MGIKKGKTEFLFLLLTAILFFVLGNIFSINLTVKSQQYNQEDLANKQDTSFYPLLRSEMEKLFYSKTMKGFSGAVLLSHKKNIIYENYQSWQTKRIKTKITPNSRFQLASVSKQFTAVSVLKLVEKGLVKLEDTVQKFIPEFPYKNITIHQLLCHRSGLPNYIYLLDKTTKTKQIPVTADSLLDYLVKNQPAIYSKPGKRFKYSNTGYVILSLIVERITGEPFYNYLRNNLFEPAGMFQTELYVPNLNDNFPNMLTGYSKNGIDSKEDYLNGCYGDKGVWSTARDLLLWDQSLYDTVIIKNETLALALTPHGMPTSSKHNYGYGWRIAYSNQNPVYYHTGWWQGFKTLLMRFPEHKITVVVLKNTLSGSMIHRDDIVKIMNRCFSIPDNYYDDEEIEEDSTDLLHFGDKI